MKDYKDFRKKDGDTSAAKENNLILVECSDGLTCCYP